MSLTSIGGKRLYKDGNNCIKSGLIGLVIGLALIRLSVKRTRKQYEINHAACVACALCFSYCPQNKNSVELRKSSES